MLFRSYNVCAEEVKGEVNGKPYQGIVYSAMNDKGEKVGNPVKASRIGKSVGYEAVQRRMEKSGEAIKNGKLKERTRKIVATAMQTARSRKELERQLKKQGIDVVFRQNDNGRIYGVTFIDHDSRVVLNGSRLGKEYSANVFNERFSGETGKIHQPELSAPQQDQSNFDETFMAVSPKAENYYTIYGYTAENQIREIYDPDFVFVSDMNTVTNSYGAYTEFSSGAIALSKYNYRSDSAAGKTSGTNWWYTWENQCSVYNTADRKSVV